MAHSHCDGCFKASCRATDACPVQPCPWNCGVSLHRCKFDEHSLHTCPAAPVPCTNASFGCEAVLPRAKLGSHLARCPASVVQCRFAYDRTTGDPPSTTRCADEDFLEEREPLIDERAMQADLALAEQDGKFYGRRLHDDGEPLRFSLDCHPGSLVTDPSSKSTARKHSLPPRARVCIAASAPQYSYSGHSTAHYFCFPCNETVRRDEFSGHWRDCHLGVHTNLSSMVERCPLRSYGCRHGVLRLTPTPNGASLEYLPEADCFSVKLPDYVARDCDSHHPSLPGVYAQHIQKQQELACYGYGDETQSYDVLSQLPAEILVKICDGLDSLGLWNLSLVNRYLRSVCYNLVKRRGIVYQCWQRNRATGRWEQGEKRWSFSRVFRGTGSWSFTDAPALCGHVASCSLLASLARTHDPDTMWEMPCLQQLSSQLRDSTPSHRHIHRITSEGELN